ncbi:polymer-forming cytoskeletal protein [Patescibacteria group bacterium]|nr:polymer-forming cytoskeletal protein [Patescibacteria group bacterium]
MLGKETKVTPEDAETIIGSGVKVDGKFRAYGNVIIKGELTGSLKTENDLQLKEGGVVNANVRAKNASIDGEIKGNLNVEEEIKLGSSAKLLGDINCSVLAIEQGAVINGKCQVGGREDAPEEVEEVDEE